jgi:hypothetical protein
MKKIITFVLAMSFILAGTVFAKEIEYTEKDVITEYKRSPYPITNIIGQKNSRLMCIFWRDMNENGRADRIEFRVWDGKKLYPPTFVLVDTPRWPFREDGLVDTIWRMREYKDTKTAKTPQEMVGDKMNIVVYNIGVVKIRDREDVLQFFGIRMDNITVRDWIPPSDAPALQFYR